MNNNLNFNPPRNAANSSQVGTEITRPLNTDGSLQIATLTPVFQTDFVYGANDGQTNYGGTLSGTATASDSVFTLSSGTTVFAQAFLQGRKRLRYRQGEGVVGRFSAIFDTPVNFSYQVVGFGHAEDGVYFGYKSLDANPPEFGILYTNRGVREVRTLTITTASSTAENITVTLNSVAYSIAVTNSADIARTVWEISKGDYDGWSAFPQNSTVVFVKDDAGSKSGTYSISGTTVLGTFASTKVGVASTEAFYPQSTWNGDKLDGSGASGKTADWQKGNEFEIKIKPGFGSIEFDVEAATDENKSKWVTVHTMLLTNILTATSFRNPSFPFSAAVYSAGSTTDLQLKIGGFSGFVEGNVQLTGNRFTYSSTRAAYITDGVYKPFFTILNKRYFNDIASQVVVNLVSMGGHIEDNASAATIVLIKNGTLTGNPSFTDYDANSVTDIDTSATGVTFANNSQVLFSLPLGKNGGQIFTFADSITLQPGEYITVAGKADNTTLDYASVSLNTREDQ